jgi:nucleoid-associated protein EbfC
MSSEGFDIQGLLAQAQEMQQRLMDAQANAAAETVEGSAGGGKVRVTMAGTGEMTAIRIDPSVVDPDDVEMLEDLVLAAVHDAGARVIELAQQQMGSGLLGGLGELGGLGSLFGGDQDADQDDDEDRGRTGVIDVQLPPGQDEA